MLNTELILRNNFKDKNKPGAKLSNEGLGNCYVTIAVLLITKLALRSYVKD
jgi:hypothetical protein